ncbi:hypothetical protein B0H19DRAFT_1272626 [Mycena capillaripes]|nr:hypothetical protein B0H19DRAFT_1272385 [Mycena capillaripes]KAJ6533241.1 hypothetical protein B0H19DRAFT_1272626 [Mycena capillaripes]
MSSSFTPDASSNPFMKRRRAYVACSNCRKRKIKCVTVSEVDYRPCTRCAQKGLKCEYFTTPEDDQSDTVSPPEIQPPARDRDDRGWTPQPITPPSAGISGYLSSSRGSGARPNPVPPAGNPRYPYRPRPDPTMPATSSAPWGQQQPPSQHQQPGSGYPPAQMGFAPMQHPGGSASQQQYYNSGTPYLPASASNAGYGGGGGAYYNQNQGYGPGYVPQANAPWSGL